MKPNHILWEDGLESGNASVDAEHKLIIEGLNRLNDSLETQSVKNTSQEILKWLEGYVNTHFRNEEAEVRNKCNGCAFQEKNCQAHNSLRKRIITWTGQLSLATAEDSKRLLRQIHMELTTWFLNHIHKTDVFLFQPNASSLTSKEGWTPVTSGEVVLWRQANSKVLVTKPNI